MLLRTGAPKALFRPGSSTVVSAVPAGPRALCGKTFCATSDKPGVRSRYSWVSGSRWWKPT